jgi:hypothetical protein
MFRKNPNANPRTTEDRLVDASRSSRDIRAVVTVYRSGM